MASANHIVDAFPEIDDIEDSEMREKVILAWEKAIDETEFDDLHEIIWWPAFPEEFDNEMQVSHIRHVTHAAVEMANALTAYRDDLEIDMDKVIAGALLHDVSKLYEMEGDELGEFNDYLKHPHYSIHVLADVGFSLEMINIVMGHTELSNVNPKSIEARLIELGDLIVTDGVFWEKTGDFKPTWE